MSGGEGEDDAAARDLSLFREVFAETRERRRLTVLVVEDDPEDLHLLKRCLLAMTDYVVEVVPATTVDTALAIARTFRFDVALVDYWLGGDTGPRVVRALGGAESRVPIICITGLANDAYKLAGLKAGAMHCIGKMSLSAELLQDTIRSVLHMHARTQALRTA